MVGICKLCQSEKELLTSHIIPNSYFKKLKPNGPAIQGEVTLNVPNIKSQDSLSEKLLCKQCEQQISIYEKYVSEFTRSSNFINSATNTKSAFFENLNYKLFRLFQLSILFRASVAERREYYYTKLTSNQTDEIRYMLLNEVEPNEYIFGCQMKLLVDWRDKTPFNKIVGMPAKKRKGLTNIYYFVFGGLAWEFFVPRFDRLTAKSNNFIKRDGTLSIPVLDSFDYEPFMETMDILLLKEKIGMSKI